MKLNLPVILLRGTLLMPEAVIKLEFEDEASKIIIEESEIFHDKKILVVTSVDGTINNLPAIGIIATISRKLELPNGKIRVELRGNTRAQILQYLRPNSDTIESIVKTLEDMKIPEGTKQAVMRKLYNEVDNYIKQVPLMSNSILNAIHNTDDLSKITDIVVNHMNLDNKRLFEYLMQINVVTRVEMILEDMYKEEQLVHIEENIDTKVKKELDKDQKNFYLKEKIKLIKTEIGEVSKKEEEVIELKKDVSNLNASQSIKEKIIHEIDRYESMSNLSPELSQVRSYIDLMLSLPWNNYSSDIEDFNLVTKTLDKSHFGLDEVKTRILEYLAVKKHSNEINTPILCLVGPPGVGKTSLASSIAESMGRAFVKMSVGGIEDEALIKGHIRTYIGATSGKIIDGLRRAKTSNPVFLIDEIDKINVGSKGDPASSLLEVLDTNQNKYFKDNYVDEEYDLSNVLFITTANDVSTIPLALRDRLEIINIEGYTELEKVQIAKNYLIPKICKNHGISDIKISDENILNIVRFYTRESGLRELERMLSKIARKIVTNKVLNNKRIVSTVSDISKYLGKRKYENDSIEDAVGIVNGLAYTTYGGELLKIESSYFEGNSELIITGSIGEIATESARIALSYIKSNYKLFDISYKIFKNDIHINIPNIDVKKDGPSAGVAIVTCLISTLTNMKISNKIAMTGEITLRGNVIKVGGLKEKIIGAYINNIEKIFIPYANIKDLDEISDEIKNKITFIPVKRYEEIYNYLKRD